MPSSVASSPYTDPAADVLVAALTPVLAIAMVWLLLSVGLTLLAGVVDRAHRPSLARFLRSLALPRVRRLVERTVATSMAVSLVTSAAPPAHAVAAVHAVGAVGSGDARETPSPLEEPVVRHDEHMANHPPPDVFPAAPAPRSTSPAHRVADAAINEDVDPGVHVVVAGENLWTVAAQVLGKRTSAAGRSDTVGDPEIAQYWSHLIELNSTSLRSGDPDLVFPGERLALPPV